MRARLQSFALVVSLAGGACGADEASINNGTGDAAARAACWARAEADCMAHAECSVRTAHRWREAEGCYEAPEQFVYCAPADGCSNAWTHVEDPSGGCWSMSALCDLPSGWSEGCAAISAAAATGCR